MCIHDRRNTGDGSEQLSEIHSRKTGYRCKLVVSDLLTVILRDVFDGSGNFLLFFCGQIMLSLCLQKSKDDRVGIPYALK